MLWWKAWLYLLDNSLVEAVRLLVVLGGLCWTCCSASMFFLHWGSKTGSGTTVPSEYLGKLDKHICHPPRCSAFGFFCCQGTLLAHVQSALCLDSQILFWRAAPLPVSPSLFCCRGSSFSSAGFCIYPCWISKVPLTSFLQPVQGPLNGSSALKHLNCPLILWYCLQAWWASTPSFHLDDC